MQADQACIRSASMQELAENMHKLSSFGAQPSSHCFLVGAACCKASSERFAVSFPVSMNERMRVMQRQPRRISITLSYQVHEALLTRSEEEGRSLSNLCAFLLEEALRDATRLLVEAKPNATRPAGVLADGQMALRRDGHADYWRQRP